MVLGIPTHSIRRDFAIISAAVRRRCALEAPDVRSHQTGSDLTALAASNSDVHDRTAAAYVPLSFAPGEAYQFDWSHEVVLLSGMTVIVKAAHVRLCHSRMYLPWSLIVSVEPWHVMTTYFRLALDVSLKQEKIAILGIGPEEGLGYDARFRPAGCEPLPRSQVPQREPTKCRRND